MDRQELLSLAHSQRRNYNEFELQFAPAVGDGPNIAPTLAATKISLGDVHALA
jgi:hypothetical protein